ncbi:hypothetical protein HPB48_006506 [Haemaphysalis longicornis]|uniref:Uncharacterized protein n=1 Tax=Haemaphysalis longicornis TaxID=44386 RepID=A0A9J6GSP6_HAELO|nr:hypothetical protein HPB48_006506 [Haemaphysalis longicornis]
MPVDLYLFAGSAPCTFVQMVAKHIGVDLNLKELDFLRREHESAEFTKVSSSESWVIVSTTSDRLQFFKVERRYVCNFDKT